MIIRCWGARGSIPVSGKEYLKYGGSTTCIEIRTQEDEIVIIDAGSGIRNLGNKLIQEDCYDYYFIFTHAHMDHVMGFPFFKPLYVSRTHISMYGCPFAQESIKKMISKTMSPPTFPVNIDNVNAHISYKEECSLSFSIKSMTVTPIFLSHPNQGLGYKFVEDGRTFVFLTDNELAFKHPGGLDYNDYLNFCSGADFLIHDSEYTEDEYKKTKTWGHSLYKDAL
ncbi:MAG: MBL fold metallo-hydrolase, partial [Thermodesulfobacteriota bacterium]|nr:MBL fold metallo-hydrolase [Thermodesulfobacteriota bacterium]